MAKNNSTENEFADFLAIHSKVEEFFRLYFEELDELYRLNRNKCQCSDEYSKNLVREYNLAHEKISNCLKELPQIFNETYSALSGLGNRLCSAQYHTSIKKVYDYKQMHTGTTKLDQLVDHRISHEVERVFCSETDFSALHSFLLMDNRFGIDWHLSKLYTGHDDRFKAYPEGEYYFNGHCSQKLAWLIAGIENAEQESRTKLIRPAQITVNSSRHTANSIAEIISYDKYFHDTDPMKVYLPEIEISGLPINNGNPVITSFCVLKGYWEMDDMSDNYNRFEIMISKNEINSGVSMRSHNCGIPDDCK